MGDAQMSGNRTGAASEVQRGTLTRKAANFQFLPGNAMLNSGAQGFGGCFFGSKSGSKALGGSGFRSAIGDFLVSKDAAQKAFAEALDGAGDARNFDQIDAGAHQHEATVAQQKVFSGDPEKFALMRGLKISDAVSVGETTGPGRSQKGWELNLMALCADDAPRTVRFLTGAVMACGGCVLSRRFDSADSAAIEFEFFRATCVEMYSVLIAAGLELSAQSHQTMATLCQCTRETLESTAGDTVRVEVSIQRQAAGSKQDRGSPSRLTHVA
jgi:hypothetical protein